MNTNDFVTRCVVTATVILFVFLMGALISSQKEARIQRERCVKAGGVFIESSGSGFCVKEFMPMTEGQ